MMMMLWCGDLESVEAVVARASRRMRGASSILETGPGVEVRRLLCGPYVTPANQEVGARVRCHQGECCSPPLIGVNLASPIVQNIWSESCSQFVFTLLTHLHFVKTHSKSELNFL